MKRILQFFLFLFLSMAFGCSGPKIAQDFDPSIDFSRLKTYHWRSQDEKKPENALVDERLHTAVDNALAEKSYQKIYNGTGDFSVSYQYRVLRNPASSNLHTGVGIGGGSGGVFGGIGIGAFGLGDNQDEATLTINIWDALTGRLIWQGSNTRRVSDSGDPAKAAAQIIRQVDDIMVKFPPLPK